jgi:hypothetical protein
MRRWEELDGLLYLDHEEVVDQALTLCASDHADDRLLGAEMLDVMMGRGADVSKAEAVLRQVCQPDQDPEVLAAALGPYAMTVGASLELYFELLGHPDARVRKAAAQMLGYEDDDPETAERTIEALVGLLHEDPAPRVRTEAAEKLVSLFRSYDEPYTAHYEAVSDALSMRLDDEVPAIRCAAIETLISSTTPAQLIRLLTRLKTELAASDVDSSFVGLSSTVRQRCKVPEDIRGDLYDAVVVLRDTGWSERAEPGEYPRPTDRDVMLTDALKSLRGRRRWPWQAADRR